MSAPINLDAYTDNESFLDQQLRKIAPALNIDLPKPKPPVYPAGTQDIVNIPPLLSPDTNVVAGYDPNMEKESWGIYTDIISQRDMAGLNMDPLNSICECNQNKSDLNALQAQCSQLTEYNCKKMACCVYTSQNRCVAGDRTGPTAEFGGNLDYYYYQNKCYGNKCPSKKSCPN